MRFLVTVSLGVALLTGSAGRAESLSDQEKLLHQGVELRRQGKAQDALEVFQRAVAIKETPHALAQLALCEQSLGLWTPAETHMKGALRSEHDPWIVKNRSTLDDAFTTIERHLGSLEVWGSPAGAEITIDGASFGTLPASGPLRLPIGEVKLAVRKDGYSDVTRTVQIDSSQVVREHVELHPVPANPPSLAATQPSATSDPAPKLLASNGGDGSEPTETVSREATAQADSDEHPPIYKRWWFWTAIAVVAGSAGASAYLLTHRSSTPTMACDPSTPCSHL